MPSLYSLTSESVTEGHPDKVCDKIADAILDEILRQDPQSRVAVEVFATNGLVIVAGEMTTKGYVDIPRIARNVIREVGYTDPELGFHYETCGILVSIQEQSPDIARGVSRSRKENLAALGAGDQGIMYGYATNETPELMPLPIVLAHRLTRRLAEVRKKKILKFLRPDGKAQVTVDYEEGRPKRINTILISSQHTPDVSMGRLKTGIKKEVIKKVLPRNLIDSRTKILINPTGRFVLGGPRADSGLTGRKIIVDTYGGIGSHGGGSMSGKDPTKVDRSGSYAARWVAKHIVAARLAEKAEVQIAYAIGVPEPLSLNINTFGTGVIPDEKICKITSRIFDLRPGMIIKELDLRRPRYRQVAAYGHFGRTDLGLPWERLSKLKKLKQAARSSIKRV